MAGKGFVMMDRVTVNGWTFHYFQNGFVMADTPARTMPDGVYSYSPIAGWQRRSAY
jgi:hypothetical protein